MIEINAIAADVGPSARMAGRDTFPRFPQAAALVLRAAPLAPLQIAGDRLMASVMRRHASLVSRLGRYASTTFLIDPTDLPLAFVVRPDEPRFAIVRNVARLAWDSRIAGPLSALLGLLHGVFDGDALFFARDLVIEGDTEAILALRNAIDDAEIDLAAEASALFGPLARHVAEPVRTIFGCVAQLTGVACTRRRAELRLA